MLQAVLDMTTETVSPPRKVASRAPNRRGEGDLLREQLIEAASRLLAAPLVEEPLSLRAVAREVGVVPQSVYIHFSDKTQLVRAVMERRFGELSRLLQAAEDTATTVVAKLRALPGVLPVRPGVAGPLCAAVRNAGHWPDGHRLRRLAWRGDVDHLVTAVQRCIDAGAAPRDNPFVITTSLWTGLHGIVSLRLSKP